LRRSPGEGSIRFNEKLQRWEYRVSYHVPGVSERKRKTFVSTVSRKDAQKKGEDFLAEIAKGIIVGHSNIIVQDWMIEWLEAYKKNTLKVKTYERYESIINNYIKGSSISKVKVKELLPIQVQQFLNDLLASGGTNGSNLSPRSVNMARSVLSEALDEAVNNNLLLANPVLRTRPFKAGKTQMHILTTIEAEKLLEEAKKSSYNWYLVIMLGIYAGLRIGEIFGLKWDCVDFEAKCVHIRRTLVTTKSGSVMQDSTKTLKSTRSVLLPDNLINALKSQYLSCTLHKQKDEAYCLEFVICKENGMNLTPNHFSSHVFKELLLAASIDKSVRVHDLRHTHATWLVESGVDIKTVSERLGHATTRITLDTYTHVTNQMQQQAVDAINNLASKKAQD